MKVITARIVRTRVQNLLLCSLLLAMVGGWLYLLFGPTSSIHVAKTLKSDISLLQFRIKRFEKKCARLALLHHNEAHFQHHIEVIAREELQLAYPDETLYLINNHQKT